MYFTLEKAQKYVSDLHNYIFEEVIKIETFKHLPRDVEGAHRVDFDDTNWADFSTGGWWGGRDQTHWFRTDIEIPLAWQDAEVALFIIHGTGESGGLAGSEALAYFDGVAIQGLDVNHHEIHLTAQWKSRGKIKVAIKAFSGLQNEMRHFKKASLVRINVAAEDFYFRARTMLEAIKVLPVASLDRENLLNLLNEAINAIDFRKPGSPEFYNSITQANDLLKKSLAEYKPQKENQPVFTAVGHSHIDVAWLWRLKHTREKSSRTFSTVNHLMEQYPEYYFVQSQPQLYEYMKKDYPEIYARIQDNVRAGKWEVTGGMWVEADCNVPSGESLVRQFLFGTRFMKQEFGVECQLLWLPDVFGYSWALPQIIIKSGLKYFMTTKISWSQYNRPAYDTFNWRGLDGTEVLTHFITTTESLRSRFFTYNGILNPASLQRGWEHYQQKDINDHLLLAYGWGDGGGGPTKEMIEIGKRMQELPGLPQLRFGKAEPYFADLELNVSDAVRLPVVDGELYLEYHRGTYTSQAQIKRDNRKGEVLLHDVEFLHSLACQKLHNHSYPQEEINENWKILLRNQFHDILPGSSIIEVYEDAAEEFAFLFAQGRRHQNNALQLLADQVLADKEKVVVFNSLSWQRAGVISLPWRAELDKKDFWTENGELLISKKVEYRGKTTVEVDVPAIPALGYATLFLRPQDGKKDVVEKKITIRDHVIESELYRIEFNEKGQIISLFDKEIGRELIASGQLGNEFQAFEDRPMDFDAWDIDVYYQEKQYPVNDLTKWEVVEDGPNRVVIDLAWRFLDSDIRQRITVYGHRRAIEFKTDIDWREQQILLKVAFPVNVRSTTATHEIQFGNVERPTHWNTSWDYAKFETAAQKWVDLSQRDYGVSLLNDCKYGHDIKNNVIRLTLLTSGIDPDPGADQGYHEFTYSLLPHKGDWFEANTTQAGYELNYPLLAQYSSTNGDGLAGSGQLLQIQGKSTILDTVKKAEDSEELVLRFYEFGGACDEVKVSFPKKLQSVMECNLMEKDIQSVDFRKNEFIFCLKPYEIRTFRLR